MKDSTRTQLKIMVERAVRPVRATLARKRKMREEMLAHVTAVFEEEAARPGGDEDALARTGQRFGNAAELTTQLQASLPGNETWAWYWESFFKKPGTSPWYRASRLALITAAGSVALIGLAFLMGEQPSLFVMSFLVAIFMGLSVSWFLFLPLIDWLRHRLFITPEWSWRKVVDLGVAAGVFLLPFWGFGLLISSLFKLDASVIDSLPMAGLASLLVPPVFLVLARLANEEARHHQEWADLPIDC